MVELVRLENGVVLVRVWKAPEVTMTLPVIFIRVDDAEQV